MDGVLQKAAVQRFISAKDSLEIQGEVAVLSESARTAPIGRTSPTRSISHHIH